MKIIIAFEYHKIKYQLGINKYYNPLYCYCCCYFICFCTIIMLW